jgi:hypothetical protein
LFSSIINVIRHPLLLPPIGTEEDKATCNVQRATTAKVSIRAKGIRPFARVQLVQRRAMVAFFLKEQMIACSLFFLLPSVHSLAFRPVWCKAQGDIVLLLKDRVTGDVVRVDDDDDDDDGTRRLGDSREELVTSGLRGADLFDDKYWSEGIVPKSGRFAEQSQSLQEGDETFYMRECFCAYRGDYSDPVYWKTVPRTEPQTGKLTKKRSVPQRVRRRESGIEEKKEY